MESVRFVLAFALALVLVPVVAIEALGCEDPPRAAPPDAGEAAPAPAPPPPRRDGCVRNGRLDGIESDPTCIVGHASEDAMRSVMRNLAITLAVEPPEVIAGNTALVTLTIRNRASVETLVLLEARPRPLGPRTDWSRVVGIPEARDPAISGDAPKLFFPIVTADAYDRDVDSLPTISGSASTPATPTVLGVRLRPGGKLSYARSWWALRIPAPASIVVDEAGHRFVPKTAAVSLAPGEYGLTMDVPFSGLSREERKAAARVRVVRPPLLDGGPAH